MTELNPAYIKSTRRNEDISLFCTTVTEKARKTTSSFLRTFIDLQFSWSFTISDLAYEVSSIVKLQVFNN